MKTCVNNSLSYLLIAPKEESCVNMRGFVHSTLLLHVAEYTHIQIKEVVTHQDA